MRNLPSLAGSLALLSLLLAVPVTPAHAQLVWNNGMPSSVSFGNNMSDIANAEDFVLSSDTTIGAIRYWISPITLDLSEFNGTVGWAIYANNAGSVGATLASGSVTGAGLIVTDTGVPNYMGIDLGVEGYNFRQVDFAIPSTALSAGTYWLQLKEGLINSPYDGSENFWAISSLHLGSFHRFDVNETNPVFDKVNDVDLAFQLFTSLQVNAAPEPGTAALLGVGMSGCLLAGGGLVLRRRK